MKTLGVLGGMSWESTASYYRLLNQGVKARLGGLHSARLLLHSVDFAEIEAQQRAGQWHQAGQLLAQAAEGLERAGAEGILIATNTMHKVAEQVAAAVSVPLLHIADATGAQLCADGINKVGLLGTAFTMEQAFYRERLEQRFDLEVVTPTEDDRQTVHRIIYEELCQGLCLDASRAAYVAIIDKLKAQGAEAVILGCTEIGLLIQSKDSVLPLYDTTELHASAAVDWMLSQSSSASVLD
ncbi:aspartate/glutamate racemase family protein [Ferrimonas marina]|uniref:Aspartate racemase n=1 Tax=Ferrimonas marina TaxID=299255 RepID=A0A1M5MJD3_9GAMM|nr:aspartate/glutamate racemase family protein [Ferrimonas marina]SHG77398.1 aspartate racemase [Ferrimonas marina]